MYTELIKIIEGGLNRDKEKVASYAKLLADKLKKEGNDSYARKINSLIEGKSVHPVYLDQFITKPVDKETRLDIVDVILPEDNNVDIILSKYIIKEIDDFILSLSYIEELHRKGFNSTNSLLLYGPPGCGKTSIAKYISYKMGLPLVIAKLDALVSSLLGNTAKNIRKIFEYANSRPCILFLDEFDAIAKARDDKYELGELKRVVNSLLQNIDEYINDNVLVAATNHHQLLDRAIWRRFSSIIEVSKPKEDSIKKLIKLYLKNINYDFSNSSTKIEVLCKELRDLSPSNIKSICNNAIRKTVIQKEEKLSYTNLLYEIYLYKNHKINDIEETIRYLNENGVSQKKIKDLLNLPIRTIRSYLSD